MTLAIIAVVVAVIIVFIWIAAWRKARQTGVVDVTWPDAEQPATTEKSEDIGEVPEEAVADTTIVEDEPKLVEPPSLVMTDTNTVAVEPIPNPWENCKTVECEPNGALSKQAALRLGLRLNDEQCNLNEALCKEVPKAKKERKPRKTPLERAEAAIAKLEGQIGRRTVLLKQLKKPVTKDERLNKWKASLKELRAARKELLKAAKSKKSK